MSDLDGQDAFDKLMEVALESRVDVRRAQDERDLARAAQREAERLAAQRFGDINRLMRENAEALPRLKELWEAADVLRSSLAADNTSLIDRTDSMARLGIALSAAAGDCDQPPF